MASQRTISVFFIVLGFAQTLAATATGGHDGLGENVLQHGTTHQVVRVVNDEEKEKTPSLRGITKLEVGRKLITNEFQFNFDFTMPEKNSLGTVRTILNGKEASTDPIYRNETMEAELQKSSRGLFPISVLEIRFENGSAAQRFVIEHSNPVRFHMWQFEDNKLDFDTDLDIKKIEHVPSRRR